MSTFCRFKLIRVKPCWPFLELLYQTWSKILYDSTWISDDMRLCKVFKKCNASGFLYWFFFLCFSVSSRYLQVIDDMWKFFCKLISCYALFDWSRYKKCPRIHRCISGNMCFAERISFHHNLWMSSTRFDLFIFTFFYWVQYPSKRYKTFFFLKKTDRNGKRKRRKLKELNDRIQVGSYLCSVSVLTKYFDSIGLKKNVFQKIFFHFT